MIRFGSVALVAWSLTGFALAQAPAQPAAAVPPPAPAAPAAQAFVPVVGMADQFDVLQDVRKFRGHVVVLLYGDRAAMSANQALGSGLHVEFHPSAKGLPPAAAQQAATRPLPDAPSGVQACEVYVVPVAVIGSVPAAGRGVVRAMIRRNASDVPVWLDFDNVMKSQFGMVAGEPNCVVLDTLGRLRYRASGKLDAHQYAHLVQTIDQLRREALPK